MDIEQRALELVNEVEVHPYIDVEEVTGDAAFKALCRAIEAGDAEREAHDAYRQEVSDGLTAYFGDQAKYVAQGHLGRFIIQPKTDPLVEAIEAAMKQSGVEDPVRSETVKMAEQLRAALKSRGGEIIFTKETDI